MVPHLLHRVELRQLWNSIVFSANSVVFSAHSTVFSTNFILFSTKSTARPSLSETSRLQWGVVGVRTPCDLVRDRPALVALQRVVARTGSHPLPVAQAIIQSPPCKSSCGGSIGVVSSSRGVRCARLVPPGSPVPLSSRAIFSDAYL